MPRRKSPQRNHRVAVGQTQAIQAPTQPVQVPAQHQHQPQPQPQPVQAALPLTSQEIQTALQNAIRLQRALLQQGFIETITSNEYIEYNQIEAVLRYLLVRHNVHQSVGVFPFFTPMYLNELVQLKDSAVRHDPQYRSWLPANAPLANRTGLTGVALRNRDRAETLRHQKDAAIKAEAKRLIALQGLNSVNIFSHYLRAVSSDPTFLGNSATPSLPFGQCEQWVIPLLMHQHITMVLGRRDVATNTIHLVYYNSLGVDLNPDIMSQLVDFHRRLPSRSAVTYQNISHKDQNEPVSVNCGIISMTKILDMIFAQKNISTNYFKIDANSLLVTRREMAHMLREMGMQTAVPPEFEHLVPTVGVLHRNMDTGIDSPVAQGSSSIFTFYHLMLAGALGLAVTLGILMPGIGVIIGEALLESTVALVMGGFFVFGVGVSCVNWMLRQSDSDEPEPPRLDDSPMVDYLSPIVNSTTAQVPSGVHAVLQSQPEAIAPQFQATRAPRPEDQGTTVPGPDGAPPAPVLR